jgi:hypothetical protein
MSRDKNATVMREQVQERVAGARSCRTAYTTIQRSSWFFGVASEKVTHPGCCRIDGGATGAEQAEAASKSDHQSMVSAVLGAVGTTLASSSTEEMAAGQKSSAVSPPEESAADGRLGELQVAMLRGCDSKGLLCRSRGLAALLSTQTGSPTACPTALGRRRRAICSRSRTRAAVDCNNYDARCKCRASAGATRCALPWVR